MWADSPIVYWHQPKDDPPDICCLTAAGRRVGVEMKEWIDQEQIAHWKQHENIERGIQEALTPIDPNPAQHVAWVWLSAKPTRFQSLDAADFRAGFLRLVHEIDKRMPNERLWRSPQGFVHRDFSRYSALDRYLHWVQFFSTTHDTRAEDYWVRFPTMGGAFGERDLLRPLLTLLGELRVRYAHLVSATAFDEWCLLLHYTQAHRYNIWAETPFFGFDQIAAHAQRLLSSAPFPFARVFLHVSTEGKSYRLL